MHNGPCRGCDKPVNRSRKELLTKLNAKQRLRVKQRNPESNAARTIVRKGNALQR